MTAVLAFHSERNKCGFIAADKRGSLTGYGLYLDQEEKVRLVGDRCLVAASGTSHFGKAILSKSSFFIEQAPTTPPENLISSAVNKALQEGEIGHTVDNNKKYSEGNILALTREGIFHYCTDGSMSRAEPFFWIGGGGDFIGGFFSHYSAKHLLHNSMSLSEFSRKSRSYMKQAFEECSKRISSISPTFDIEFLTWE